jgi:pathogenesis-related protein 1
MVKSAFILLLTICLTGTLLLAPASFAGDKKKKKSDKEERVPSEAAEFLQVHNEARARVGVAPLRWSETLAQFAQQWADHLASTGTFQHRDQGQTGYGENLFGGSDGYSPADAARHWLEERAAYRGGPITAQNFQSVGHYTQMVWSTTTEVGYGLARGRNGMVIIVGNYSPGGNRSGQKPY